MRRSKFFIFLGLVIVFLISAGLFLKSRHTVPVLMYHSILDREDLGSLAVDPGIFARQMKYLEKGNYNVISIGELVEGIKSDKDFPRRTVAITFDDGCASNFTHAFPVLHKHSFPATIFLVTDFIGEDPDYLTWEQVVLMQEHGIDFGGHTRTHRYLPDVDDASVLWEEIYGSKQAILEKTGKEPEFFCYPTGGFSEEIKKMVKKAGYRGAFATNRGYDPLNNDVYEINRIKVTNSDAVKPLNFWAKLSGYYDVFWSRKAPN